MNQSEKNFPQNFIFTHRYHLSSVTATRPMKIQISPQYQTLSDFIRSLTNPLFFEQQGEILHEGRNTIKLFQWKDQRFVVKRYGHITLMNRLIYGTLRHSKANRAYHHAILLRQRGIDTPQEVAFLEIRRHGLLHQSYFVSAYSEYLSLWSVTEHYLQDPESQFIVHDLSAFLFKLHEAGVLHKDLNIGNILYQHIRPHEYVFQVIDTNRMTFHRHLSIRQRLDNLRRLSCPVPVYLDILDRYAHLISSNTTAIQLKGTMFRLFFEMRQQIKQGVKKVWKKKKNVDSSKNIQP